MLLCVSSSLLGVACQSPQHPGSAAVAAPERPPLDFAADTAWPEPYASDALWRRAAGGSDIDEARLAARDNLESLLTALEHGGSLGSTALRSLAYARDRRKARKRLCELAPRAAPATRASLLAAIFDAVAHAPSDEEAVDVEADATCKETLAKLSQNTTLAPSDRDRAQAALARIGHDR